MEKRIRREPIQLNNSTVMVLHIFTRTGHMEDLWMTEVEKLQEEGYEQHHRAAKQLLDQLEDHWAPKFMMALRDEANKKLKEHDDKHGTQFANG